MGNTESVTPQFEDQNHLLKSPLEQELDKAISEIGPLIMTWEKYNSERRNIPYFFEISRGSQKLSYYGARHWNDPDDPQFGEIRARFEDFCRDKDSANCVVLVEGSAQPIIADWREAIITGGEGAFITSLAAEKIIQAHCPEPDRKFLTNKLLEKFSKDEIVLYYFANATLNWSRHPKRPRFEQFAEPRLQLTREELDWSDFEFTLDHMKKIHEQIFQVPFDERNLRLLQNITMPTNRDVVTNKVACEADVVRDSLIVAGIKHLWDEGESVFVVYGSSHAIVQEPALRKLLS